jgi:hypothetical protein
MVNVGNNTRCSQCGRNVSNDVERRQREDVANSDIIYCYDCLKQVESKPQMDNLLDGMRESMEKSSKKQWDKFNIELKAAYAVTRMADEIDEHTETEDDSDNFIEMLSRYVTVIAIPEIEGE